MKCKFCEEEHVVLIDGVCTICQDSANYLAKEITHHMDSLSDTQRLRMIAAFHETFTECARVLH